MRVLLCVAVTSVLLDLALAGCSSTPDPDTAMTQQVTRALMRATDPALSPVEARDRSVDALCAAEAALKVRANTHSENLLNANTVGYKRRVVLQSDSLDTSVRLNLDEGKTQITDRQLDVAIMGPGFFRVKVNVDSGATPADGNAYTRCGILYANRNHELCVGSVDGPRLMPPITLPSDVTDLSISEDGSVSACTASSINSIALGRFELVTFEHAESLTPIDHGLFAESKTSGPPISGSPNENGLGYVMQGALEESNVDFTRETLGLSRVAGQSQQLQKLIAKRS